MPINLNKTQKNNTIYVPKWFDSALTGKGAATGILNMDRNPSNLPSTLPANTPMLHASKKHKVKNGNVETTIIPMQVYTEDCEGLIPEIPVPDRKSMCLAGTTGTTWINGRIYNHNIYFDILVNTVSIEKIDEPGVPIKRNVAVEYRLDMYTVNDTDAYAKNDHYNSQCYVNNPSLLGGSKHSYKTQNPILTINEIVKAYSMWNWDTAAVNDWIANVSAYELACKQSEIWQTKTAENLELLASAVKGLSSAVTNLSTSLPFMLFVSHIRRLEGYNLSLDIYRDIYNCLTKYFSKDDVTRLCKQNLNLLMSDTLCNLNAKKSTLQHITNPATDTFNWTPYSPEQKNAIKSEEPLVLVQAGAGTGKSHAILGRIDYMCNIGIDPKDIMVLSFTNAAADNINAKNPNVHSMTIARMIHTIYENNFPEHTLSSNDTIRNSIDIYYPDYTTRPAYISEFKSCLTSLIKNDKNAFTLTNNFIENHYDEVIKILDTIKQTSLELEIIICYQKIDTLNEPDEIASKYLIIDEVQDNSIFEFIYTLKYVDKHEESLFIVGDSSQTLYEFRASNPKALNIMEASNIFASYRLQTNYRSKQDILTFANVLLKNIEANQFANIQLHANSIAKITKTSFTKNVKLKYCRLKKTGDFKDVFDGLMTQHVKRYVDSKIKFNEPVAFLAYTRDDIKRTQKWLEEHYPDKKIVSLVPDRMRNQTILSNFIRSFWEEAKFIPTNTIVTDIGREIKLKLGYINKSKSALSDQFALKAIADWQAHADPIVDAWLKQYHNKQLSKDDMLNMIKEDMISYEINTNAIRQSVLSAKNEQNKQQNIDDADFILSTIHSAKGLEFPNTVVIYKDDNAMNEENKRMYYVALTRAMQSELILAYNTVKSPKIEADYDMIVKSLSQPTTNTP